jgi:hypothetical protein
MKLIFTLLFLFISLQAWCKVSLYEQILENDCEITIYCETDDGDAFPSSYLVEIKNNNRQYIIKTEWFYTIPEPRFYWIDNNLFRMDFGSSFAPSRYTYFYSKELHIISVRYNLATSIVDKENNLILCAEFKLVVYNIFYPEKYIVLNTPKDSIGGLLWFSIGGNSYFQNKQLFLEYNDENWDIKLKDYNLEGTELY